MNKIFTLTKFLLIVSAVMFASIANSADKTLTVEGILKTGSLDSGIETEDGDGVGFLTDSDIGNKILNECAVFEGKCKVTVIIDDKDEYKFIKTLLKVEYFSESSVVIAPSFDCSKSSTYVEKTICSDSKLSKLDNELMVKYKKIIANSPDQASLKNDQRNWLKNVRNKCQNNLCLENAYIDRLSKFNVNTSPAQSVGGENTKTEICANKWLDAYRKEVGIDAIVRADQLEEWKSWCEKGKEPKAVQVDKDKNVNELSRDTNNIGNSIKIKGFYIGMPFDSACKNIEKVLNIDESKILITDNNTKCIEKGKQYISVKRDKSQNVDEIIINREIFKSSSNHNNFLQELADAYHLSLQPQGTNYYGGVGISSHVHAGDNEFIRVNSTGIIIIAKRDKGRFD